MNRTILPIVISLSVVMNGMAQVNYFQGTYDHLESEELGRVIPIASGYLLLGVGHVAYPQGATVLSEVDESGNVKWYKIIEDSSAAVVLTRMILCDSNHLLAAGYWRDLATGQYDNCIVKLTNSGDEVWRRVFGDSIEWESIRDVMVDYDGNYVVLGFHNTLGAPFYGQAVVMKLDTAGELLWSKEHGVSAAYDQPRQFVRTPDSGFLIVGWKVGPFVGDDMDIVAVRTDSLGDHVWTRYYGGGLDEYAYLVARSVEGGFMIAGTQEFGIGQYQGWLLKIDDDGTIEDETHYRHAAYNKTDFIGRLIQLPDGAYVVTGAVERYTGIDVSLLVKFNVDGDSLWARTYSRDLNFNHYFYGMDTALDGGFVVCGTTDTSSQPLSSEGWLLKLDEFGCLVPGCQLADTNTAAPPMLPVNCMLEVWPNPIRGSFTVELPFDDGWHLQLFDISGRLVEERALVAPLGPPGQTVRTGVGGAGGQRWNVASVPAGLYLLRAAGQDGSVASVKVVVE
jgi:hypothetical protein